MAATTTRTRTTKPKPADEPAPTADDTETPDLAPAEEDETPAARAFRDAIVATEEDPTHVQVLLCGCKVLTDNTVATEHGHECGDAVPVIATYAVHAVEGR